ncbi:chromosome partitioning protein, ParB family [Peptoclostridium litorale DSM 5388]|uniref:Nucleoid occlusion protein Noc n=1 Tax=Peptoclostridium litorale DSM 5388 TaxID=1121324 RepID=A0A069RQC1_PEPLI|nr:ParB/RepB/Spo0J family partition protein [Peptoclostridium litorale]KDR96372.1 nucleoid occlusion protein Noc [Peptoclostridium litorale DSM 5388]SIO27157.1 chromosome partitioning protein, ParB family [Peptoclostridium litorale DSM 5388]
MGQKEITWIPVKDICTNNSQPRKIFDEKKLEDLSNSIRIHGIIQPIVVQKKMDRFMIVAGERRYRASVIAGLENIPCVVWDGKSSKGIMEVALIENIQRENLNPIEEAIAYRELCEKYGLTQENIAASVGKSRPYIANMIRLLNLSDQVVLFLREGKISAGHGKALLKIKNANEQRKLANRIAEEGLSVRVTEEIIKGNMSKKEKDGGKAKAIDPFIRNIQENLINMLGTKVSIKNGIKKGKIEIEYYSEEELEHIVNTIMSG